MRIPVLFLLAYGIAASQPLTFGIKAGVPLVDPFGSAGESRLFTGGGSLELRLPAGFAVEASALYRRVGQSYSYTLLPGGDTLPLYTTRIRGNAWDFPLIGKYYLRPHSRSWQPFAGAGIALRTIGYTSDANVSVLSGAPITVAPGPVRIHDRSNLGVGATAAAGVRFHLAGRMALTPELRYTRWGERSSPRRNDPAFYLGLTF